MKFYVITKGCYSDYRIIAVTTDKEKAEKLREYCSDEYEEAIIEEFEDNSIIYAGSVYRVCFSVNGNIFGVYRESHENVIFVKVGEIKKYKNSYYVYVQADDKNHACKIAADLMAQYKYRKYVEEIEK